MTVPRLMMVGVLLGVLQVAGAADEKADASSDSLATTKRELEVLKNQRLAPTQAPRMDLPPAFDQPDLPDIRLAPDLAEAKKKQADLKKKGGTGNWLIDGVQKNGSRTAVNQTQAKVGPTPETDSDRDPTANDGEPQGIKPPGTGSQLRSGDKLERGDRSREAKAEKSQAVDNPLNQYMGEWLSPQDFTLLKKSNDVATASHVDSQSGGAGLRALSEGNGFSAGSVSGSRSVDLPGPSVPGIAASPRENPYLLALAGAPAPLANPNNFEFLTPASPPAAPPPPTSSSTFVPAPKANVSPADNLKRSDDAKYFPQLKRF